MRLCAFADEASENLSGQIAALGRNGIGLLEIRGVNGKNVSKLSPSEISETKKQLDDAGIAVWSVGSPVGKIRLDEDFGAHLEVFKRLCDAALTLGASRIRIFSFYPDEAKRFDRDAVFYRMRAMTEAAPREITLCHENEKGIYGDTDVSCLEVLREFPKLRAVFDPANFVQCGVDTLSAWEKLSGYVDYLHIKDADGNGTVVPAGHGSGHVGDIISKYLSAGGDVITCEPHLQRFSGLDALERGETVKVGNGVLSNDDAFDLGVNSTKKLIGDKLS